MADRGQKTNKALLWTAIALCVLTGGSYTRSSADFSSTDGSQPDVFVAENAGVSADAADGAELTTQADAQTETDSLSETSSETASTQSPTPEPTAEPTPLAASPEAEIGVWTASGSSWYFMVDGVGMTGWLTDTDGKRYYFDADGVMQTGWLDVDGKRYYLNADGVMQTGSVTIDGQVYTFGADGALTGDAQPADTDAGQALLSYMDATRQVTPTPTPISAEPTSVEPASTESTSAEPASAELTSAEPASAIPTSTESAS